LLADLILGHQPVLAVEHNPYCCAVLRERAAEGWFPDITVAEGDIREFDFSPYAGNVDCIAAGFPCQDISTAGRGAGIDGERSGLVREVFRAIDALHPGYVFLENSPAIRTRGRGFIAAELVSRGYRWRDGTIAAAAAGAPHRRKRWFLLAADADGLRELQQKGRIGELRRRPGNGAEETHAHLAGDRLQGRRLGGVLPEGCSPQIVAVAARTGAYDWNHAYHAGIRGVVHGIPGNLQWRVMALGNAQVPLQAAAAFMLLAREVI
jgi:DNA (cytosine-5)-methyltransferase 1